MRSCTPLLTGIPLLPVSVSFAVPEMTAGRVVALKTAPLLGTVMTEVGAWLSNLNKTPPVLKFGSGGVLLALLIARTNVRNCKPGDPGAKLAGVVKVQLETYRLVTAVQEAAPKVKPRPTGS